MGRRMRRATRTRRPATSRSRIWRQHCCRDRHRAKQSHNRHSAGSQLDSWNKICSYSLQTPFQSVGNADGVCALAPAAREGLPRPDQEAWPLCCARSEVLGKRLNILIEVLRRIHLENFMCHEHFEMEFECGPLTQMFLWLHRIYRTEMHLPCSPYVNFICGANGSGKSAVLQAIQQVFCSIICWSPHIIISPSYMFCTVIPFPSSFSVALSLTHDLLKNGTPA